jgi:hypothetical protein
MVNLGVEEGAHHAGEQGCFIKGEREITMKIQYQLRGLNPRAANNRPLDRHLEHLCSLIPISSARVVLEHQPNAAPAFTASVDLAVPGPDIHDAARDHTLEASMLKVARRLAEQVEARKNRQQLRLKGREQCCRIQPLTNKSP